MLEKWKKAIDQGKFAEAILNHELLITKLEAYGFDKEFLTYVYSYLLTRKHRTKINNSQSVG